MNTPKPRAIRWTDQEWSLLSQAAQLADDPRDRNVSTYVRRVALEAAKRNLKPRRK